ncbi:acyl-CoA dehydrogenase family protein [Nocardioides sp. J54]|uniref:acyl-CoA dehydrogenase family protein n=1 Tax=Nocardioides sp. J54 TaxID=935866 RepID=UPI00048FF646|nr:acyl-CoA dehydrogenase family protein [Nocardioides sp. J54]
MSTDPTTALDVDPDLDAMLDKLFAEVAASADADGPLDRGLWAQVAGLGLTLLTTSEQQGGSGAGWPEAWALHRAAARHAVPLPLGEHDLLGRRLVDHVGWSVGDDVLTVGAGPAGGEVTVPWGADVDTVLLVEDGPDGAVVSRHRASDLDWSRAGQLPGTRRVRTRVPTGTATVPLAREVRDELRRRGALLRSVQVVGALERCVDVAVEHAHVRTQFGRPLVAFQAVQGMLADAASEVALARAAVVAAVREAAVTGAAGSMADLGAAHLAVAVAKSCSGHAVAPVTRHAHQVLGAIGTTREHELHRFSMPALAWRADFGTADEWDAELGAAVDQHGFTTQWRSLVDGVGHG